MVNVQRLFESELRRRGFPFHRDTESGRHAVEIGGGTLLVSLENLQRDVTKDGDTGRVSRFVDAIVASVDAREGQVSPDDLYLCLEPADYVEKADFRVALSDRVDRVLVTATSDFGLITWATPSTLTALGLTIGEAERIAFGNLARALQEATVESQDIDGVKLGFLTTSLPFKASLLLAPNLKDVVGPVIGWPLMAVAPDRDFLYLWPSQHASFASRVGGVVVREYSEASYPISTEVYEITERGVRAIGEFAVE